jgi:hypothetical protein
MRRFLLLLLGALCAAGCGRPAPDPGPARPKAPGEKQWTDEEMATDPEGYLKWADGQLASQIQQREQRLSGLAGKRKGINERRDKFMGDYEAVENLGRRLGTATRRAEDEDRWPVTVAGKQWTKDEAAKILKDTQQFLSERKALAAAYDEAMTKLDSAETSLRTDISRLTALRDKVSIDLDRVRIDRSNPEMEKLRKTEAEIEHYSKILTSFTDVNVQALPKPNLSADLQSLLK